MSDQLTDNSTHLLEEGSKLIVYLEKELERYMTQSTTLQDLLHSYKLRKNQQRLGLIFQKHRVYALHNINRQRQLLADMHTGDRTLIACEIGILESQKQTIEELMTSARDMAATKRSETNASRGNVLSLLAIIVAIAAVVALDVRLGMLVR